MVVRKHHLAFSASLVILIAVVALQTCHQLGSGVRVASFNINQFPQRTAAPDKLFSTVKELDAPIVALQEVGDITATREAAMSHLGDNWRVRIAGKCNTQCVGFLYDSKRVDVLRARTHDSLKLFPAARPAYEIAAVIDDHPVTLVNVHLKAGTTDVPVRLRQLRELSKIVDEIEARGESMVIIGDFNSVGGDDRAALERFKMETELSWATSVLECSHYKRRGGGCITTTLDHAFTTHRPRSVSEAGACADVGCAPGGACPTWTRDVSDHCPFVIELR